MIEVLQATLDERVAPMVRRLNLRVVSGSKDEVVVALPVVPDIVHAGNLLCGQAILAAMDTVMVLAIVAHAGGVRRPMATVQLQTSFMRGVPPDVGEVTFVGRILRAGKSLVFGEIALKTPDGRLAAHATTSYALL